MNDPAAVLDGDIAWFRDIGIGDVPVVGGKNASLGEMYRKLAAAGVRVPNGFATSAAAFRRVLNDNGVTAEISELVHGWDRGNVVDLERRSAAMRELVESVDLGPELRDGVLAAYEELSAEAGVSDVACAVRSSATAEDLPEASFAGQQETYLMVRGAEDVLRAVRRCFASLYTARAVSYREDMGIQHDDVALSACVQRMVRSDLASSGVIFTLDPDSGHRDIVYLTGGWGLGEHVVQGRITPDAFVVHGPRLRDGYPALIARHIGAKERRLGYDENAGALRDEPVPEADRRRFCLSDDEVLQLARWALLVEDHYTTARGVPSPMDLEWAKDGITGELFIVQARPETVYSSRPAASNRVFRLTGSGTALVEGLAVGEMIATGTVRRIAEAASMSDLSDGEILVTVNTDPDWEPVLRRAAALVTERGGRTSHAAIVARELGIPAVVGAGDITRRLVDGRQATVSCAEGDIGFVYDGAVPFEIADIDFGGLPATRTAVMLNVGNPARSFTDARLLSAGVGLARMEFIFAGQVGVHPLALVRRSSLGPDLARQVDEVTSGYDDPVEFLVERLTQGISTIAAGFWPRPVVLRFSDFKTNEYANLVGGRAFEPVEVNPMLGWRGASRYHHPDYREGFELEVAAVRRVRENLGFTNVQVMVPFCRTPDEGRAVIEVMEASGLGQGAEGLEVYVMAEIPANVLRAAEFAQVFDGFSIGSNDLTQLVLGVDRDTASVAHLFDESDPAVKRACSMVIAAGHEAGIQVGICGQAPSDRPDFASFLVREGIDSISVTADALARTIGRVAEAEESILP